MKDNPSIAISIALAILTAFCPYLSVAALDQPPPLIVQLNAEESVIIPAPAGFTLPESGSLAEQLSRKEDSSLKGVSTLGHWVAFRDDGVWEAAVREPLEFRGRRMTLSAFRHFTGEAKRDPKIAPHAESRTSLCFTSVFPGGDGGTGGNTLVSSVAFVWIKGRVFFIYLACGVNPAEDSGPTIDLARTLQEQWLRDIDNSNPCESIDKENEKVLADPGHIGKKASIDVQGALNKGIEGLGAGLVAVAALTFVRAILRKWKP